MFFNDFDKMNWMKTFDNLSKQINETVNKRIEAMAKDMDKSSDGIVAKTELRDGKFHIEVCHNGEVIYDCDNAEEFDADKLRAILIAARNLDCKSDEEKKIEADKPNKDVKPAKPAKPVKDVRSSEKMNAKVMLAKYDDYNCCKDCDDEDCFARDEEELCEFLNECREDEAHEVADHLNEEANESTCAHCRENTVCDGCEDCPEAAKAGEIELNVEDKAMTFENYYSCRERIEMLEDDSEFFGGKIAHLECEDDRLLARIEDLEAENAKLKKSMEETCGILEKMYKMFQLILR